MTKKLDVTPDTPKYICNKAVADCIEIGCLGAAPHYCATPSKKRYCRHRKMTVYCKKKEG